METRAGYLLQQDEFLVSRILTDERDDYERHKMQEHVCNLLIMTERKVTLEMTLSFECRFPVRLIPRNPPVFTRLHMNNYVIRPETFN